MLSELRAVCDAADGGQWHLYEDGAGKPGVENVGGDIAPVVYGLDNATHIATFDPATVRALLDVAEAAKRLAENVETYCPCCDDHLEIVTEGVADDVLAVKYALARLEEK